VIEVQELYKYYGEKRALGPVEASIARGEVVGLLGRNGAGKTTTLRILACDLLPTSGTVTVGGYDVVRQPDEVRAKIGYLPDRPPLYDDMTVDEFLRYAAKLRGTRRGSVDARVNRAVEQTELGEVRDQLIATLSHGFRQRVGIAQAVVHDPELVVLDEPISGLDPAQIVEMRGLVRNLRGDHTVLVSSHILGEISETCDRILVIRSGRIAAAGTEAELTRARHGERVDVSVLGADVEGARRALLAVAPTATVSELASTEDGVFQLRVESPEDHRAGYCRALVEAGLSVVGLKRAERDLESVFLELSLTADEAARSWEAEAAPAGAATNQDEAPVASREDA
jgi:ABC-2 type transport system ATP-binding protein